MSYDITDLQSDGAQGGREWDRYAMPIERAGVSPAELHPGCPDCRGRGVRRGDQGTLFHDECGYLWSLHTAGRCPTEAEAREAFGGR